MKIDRVLLSRIVRTLLNEPRCLMSVHDLSNTLEMRVDSDFDRLNGHINILEDLGYIKKNESNRELLRLTYFGYEALEDLGITDSAYSS